ncbi:ATP-dependent DNA helicase DinG [Nitrosomonas marina]|uniref:DNA 5'-3' helicase n=1 Tax=Nitrosomonas marina TaxID=917 RepID=A0A1H9Z0P3_9PROT|nr:ATP-dependent DNA helicase [Nitrosomonas marina]SES74993.1 ATP-dependent DNA helicase DinG [Nitrosomonas marina]
MLDLKSIFASDGLLSGQIPGYRERSQQLEMAEAIAETMENNGVLIAEAGTGTGKTFAYLVPALLAGGKVIISTGTKTLQDQLFNRDIPGVRAALNVPVSVALLKGRANYVCRYHLERTLHDEHLAFVNRSEVKYLQQIERYAAQKSSNGDRSGLTAVPEDASVWHHVTATRENCLGTECPHYKNCFLMEARKKALAADIVVVNHHLFFADVMLRDEGLTELLPACNSVIFDEAHQLPETASLFFGESISTGQLLDLAHDTKAEALQAARDCLILPDTIAALEKSARDLRLTITEDHVRFSLPVMKKKPAFTAALKSLQEKLVELADILEDQAERSEGLENCWRRANDHISLIKRWCDDAETAENVRWVEVYSRVMQLNSTPLSIAEIFGRQLAAMPRAWIFTSATLSVNKNFDHYVGEMGLGDARSVSWDSPFNFPEQALMYVPATIPEPHHKDYIGYIVRAAMPVLKASRGRAFFLCTSLRAMQQVHEQLTVAFESEHIDYPLLLQGEASRSGMLKRFSELGNAVLIGSHSFWEGIDVRGAALSLVIIDKLPFAPPDDPVLSARIDKINSQGGNAFMDYQLPRAVISLKQGAGRLIRDESDCGVLMICDPRLTTKPYGRKIWKSLPPMKRTRQLVDVEHFFQQKSLSPAH